MSYEYPQLLLHAYKQAYPDYADFEKYTLRYRNTPDPIRVNLLKSLVKNCSFSAVWGIMESNSPEIQMLKNIDPSKYSRVRSITVSNLHSNFGTVEKFAEEMALYPSSATAKMNRTVEQSAKQIEAESYPVSSSNASSRSASQTVSVPSNRIETEDHIWSTTSVVILDGKTIVYKQVVPKLSSSWLSCNTAEYIEDAESGRRFYLTSSSIGVDKMKVLSGTSPYSFTEVYPALPSNVRLINISSGNQYYVRALKVR